MASLTAPAIVCAVRAHGEHGAILRALTEEAGLVVIYAGHYATETLGVQALAAMAAERCDVPWSFLPAPTGL